ncbi:hypothetical protein SF23_12750, partial [Streptomyces sp. MBRL 10]
MHDDRVRTSLTVTALFSTVESETDQANSYDGSHRSVSGSPDFRSTSGAAGWPGRVTLSYCTPGWKRNCPSTLCMSSAVHIDFMVFSPPAGSWRYVPPAAVAGWPRTGARAAAARAR